MRSRLRDKQKMWFVTRTRDDSHIDAIITYSKPVMKRLAVSATAGPPIEIGSGLVRDYDREIVCYDMTFRPAEGTAVYIDRTPEIDAEGNLVLTAGGDPTVLPVYVIVKIMKTEKGRVTRYGVRKT